MKLRKTILIYSHNAIEARSIKTLLDKNILNSLVNIVMSHEGIYQTILSRKISLFIVECDELTPKDASFIQSLYRNLKDLSIPFLLITSQNENPKSLDFPYHHVYRPIENKSFLKLVAKIFSEKNETAVQRARRFKTKQTAYIKNLFTHEEEKKVKIYNLSKTGAYFEFKEKPNWKKNEFLNIKIVLEDLSIQHELQGKIMWITDNGSVFGGIGVGVQFIQSKDVHKSLIEDLGKAKKYISNL